jgi:WS/DGAT/MGAT family acyltransferase
MALDRLTADDRLILWTDAAWPQDVGVLAVLDAPALTDGDGTFRLAAARAAVAARLHLVPRLRQVLHVPPRGLGWPLWVDDPHFELSQHVRQVPVPRPGGEAELLRLVASLRERRLRPSRPLWEMWFLPGLAGGRVGWFIRLHHVVADGIAGIAGLVALLDPQPDAAAATVIPWAPRRPPSTANLLIDYLPRHARSAAAALSRLTRPAPALRGYTLAWPATRELLFGRPGPLTSLNGLVGPSRQLAVARTDASEILAIAHGGGTTVNDVLLASIAGGLRRLFADRGEPVKGLTVPVYVPTSLRRTELDTGMGNRISQIIVPLPLGTDGAHERLRQISAATSHRKALARPPLGTTFGNRLLSKPTLRLIIRQRVNATTTDLIGPSSPRYFAGAEVLDLFPLLNLMGNVTLGVGALSYAGKFELLAIADGRLHPDLDAFVRGAEDEIDALSRR